MRLPKLRGFKSPFKKEYQVVNVSALGELFPEGGEVTVDALVAKGAVRGGFPVKVLGDGDITVAVTVKGAKHPLPPRPRSRPPAALFPKTDCCSATLHVTNEIRPSPLMSRARALSVITTRHTTYDTSVSAGRPRTLDSTVRVCLLRCAGRAQRKGILVRTLIQAFRTKELRNKILFTLAMIIIYRIGSFIRRRSQLQDGAGLSQHT